MFRKALILAGVMGGMALDCFAQQFYPARNYNVYDDPIAVLSADYNNNGNMDIATVGFNGSISVLLGTGNGTFQPYIVTPNPSYPMNRAFTQGDFNQDEYVDIAVGATGFPYNGIYIFINLGNGTFADPYVISNVSYSWVSTADFNNDLILDFVNAEGIILGLGGGNFGPQVSIQEIGNNAVSPADINLDNNLDIISTEGNDLRVHFGNGDGSFDPVVIYSTCGQNANDLACEDLNNDGWPDVAVCNYTSDNLSILLGTGNGNLGNAYLIPADENPKYILSEDFDEDGNADFAICHLEVPGAAGPHMTVLYGDGNGNFPGFESYGVGPPTGITSSDYDNDEYLDIAIPINGSGGNDHVSVFINTYEPIPPPVQIALNPLYLPIYINPWGGDFGYYINLTNNTDSTQTFDLWIDILLPDSTLYGPVLLREDIILQPMAHLTRLMIQQVPANAPAGRYINQGHVGDYALQEIWSEDGFPFTKVTYNGGPEGEPVSGWNVYGWSDPEMTEIASATIPDAFSLSIHPNPFNPTTILGFELRDASFVELSIYDISGRLVTTLVDGWREAGDHEITFDGSELPSGVYIARLNAADYCQQVKLVLVK